MESKIVNELLEIYKISDKEEKERKLREFNNNNNNLKPHVIDMIPVKIENTEQQKKDYYQMYVLEDDAFSEDWFERYDLKKDEYIELENKIMESHIIFKNDMFFYNSKTCYIITLNKPICFFKLDYNTEKAEDKSVKINTSYFLDFYNNGFNRGINDFEKKYNKLIENIEIEKTRNFLIKNIAISFFGDKGGNSLIESGWYMGAFRNVGYYSPERIDFLGYNSGQYYSLRKTYPALFNEILEMSMIDNEQHNKIDVYDPIDLFKLSNRLIPDVSIEDVYNHFFQLTKIKNKNNQCYIDIVQLMIFIKTTFIELNPQKQSSMCNPPINKNKIREVFSSFYTKNKNKEINQKKIKTKYFNIMNDAFSGFDSKNDYNDFLK